MKKIGISFTLSQETIEKLKLISEQKGISVSSLVELILRENLK